VRADELAEMFDLEDHYWWFRGRRTLAQSLLSRYRVWREGDRILDVGCGTGATVDELRAYGRVVGLDRSMAALGFCRTRKLTSLVCSEAGEIPFPDDTFDAVVALDVLEHVGDDARVLRESERVTRPGGVVLLTVPAFRFLWSGHDEVLHHLRRYRAPEIGALMRDAGLEILKLSYAMFLLFPPIALYRMVERISGAGDGAQTTLRSVPGVVNRLLYGLLCLEARWLRVGTFPFGVSIVGVGRKRVKGP